MCPQQHSALRLVRLTIVNLPCKGCTMCVAKKIHETELFIIFILKYKLSKTNLYLNNVTNAVTTFLNK